MRSGTVPSFARLGAAVATLVLTLLMASCQGGTEDEGSAQPGETGTAEATGSQDTSGMQPDETLRIGIGADAQSMDPPNYVLIGDLLRTDLVYDNLVELDADLEIVEGLAKQWEQIDELTWEFTLREGVQFHDGTTLDASAVKVSLERAAKAPRGSGIVGTIEEVEVVDDLTVRVHLSRPTAPLLGNLASGIAAIASPAAIEEYGEDLSQHPVGTGPYRFANWAPNNKMTLERFDEYWGDGFPIGSVEFHVVPEASTRMSALQSGDLDVIEAPPPEQLSVLEGDPSLEAITEPRARVVWFGFNLEEPKVQDPSVRRAIAHAIDKESIVDNMLEGLGTPALNGLFEPEVHDPDPPISIPYDVDEAKGLLAEAGVEDLTLTFTVPEARYFKDAEVAAVLQSQLDEVGIDLKLEVLETGTWFDKLLAFDTEVFWLGWGLQNGDPTQRLRQPFVTDDAFNVHKYSNTQYDEWADELDKLPVGSEERENVLWDMQNALIEEDMVIVPIYHMVNFWASRSELRDFHTTRLELIDIKQTHFER